MFDQQADGKLVFSKQFIKLWFCYSTLSVFQNRGSFVFDIPSPPVNQSNLTTIGYLTDPTSIVMLVVFELNQSNGPIVEADFTLTTSSDALILKVEWEVIDDSNEKEDYADDSVLRVDFYTSDDTEFNRPGNLQLIYGRKSPPSLRVSMP